MAEQPISPASPGTSLADAHAFWLSSLVVPKKLAAEWQSHAEFFSNAKEWGWRHYTVQPVDLIWRFSSKPASELIGITDKVPIETIIQVIGKHSGGADKSNADVRTSSWCRNAGALIGTAASGGGDKNVLYIVNNAEYLLGIDMTKLSAHGISARPALARLISMFETEYVLVSTPGNAPVSVDELATIKIPNPFKGRIDASGKIKDSAIVLPIEDPLKGYIAARPAVAPDKIATTGVVDPGWVDSVLTFAARVSKAATPLTGVVQMKEGLLDAEIMANAMRNYLKAL